MPCDLYSLVFCLEISILRINFSVSLFRPQQHRCTVFLQVVLGDFNYIVVLSWEIHLMT